jgi:hypothetical protein
MRAPARRGIEHPVADGVPEAGFVCERDESGGQHHAALGVVPAKQALGADHFAGLRLDDRLVVELELLSLERAPQRHLDLQPFGAPRGELGREEPEAVPPELLRVVHRRIGVLEQRLRVGSILGMDRESEAAAHVDVVALDDEGPAHFVEDLARDALGCLFVGKVLEDHDELIA